MQQLSEFNKGITFRFVAVDTLSRFVWIVPLKRKTAAACRRALIDVIEGKKRGPPVLQPRFWRGSRPVSPNPKKNWVKAENLHASLPTFVNNREFISFRLVVKPNRCLIKRILDQSKFLFSNIFTKTTLKCIINNYKHLLTSSILESTAPIHARQPLQQCWLGYQSIATELGHLRSIPVTAHCTSNAARLQIKKRKKSDSKLFPKI